MNKPVIITGLSGAGISTVLKALEDFKFEVFDNFPLSMIPQLCCDSTSSTSHIAIGVDTRTRGFSSESVIQLVKEIDARLVFITCDHSVLHRRFTETRRRHPVAEEKSLVYGLKTERDLLEPIKNKADILIDSTDKSIHDLRHMLEGYFDVHSEENMTLSLMSFGFKNGVPRDADIVMDVRFLQNPHWESTLRPKTGLDKEVGAYVQADEGFEVFLTRFKDLIDSLLPRYAQEGKSYLTIAIGCTGGRHRSVFTVETLKSWFEENSVSVHVEHRDIPEV